MIKPLQLPAMDSYIEIKADVRVVEVPERWGDIVELAAAKSYHLPPTPDRAALVAFMHCQKAIQPEQFPSLASQLLRMMGPGKIVRQTVRVERTFAPQTAPNRKSADIHR